jgi:DNA-binding MarR family transcriptional regulator
MPDVDLGTLDLATTSWLAGSAANDYLLAAVRSAGHPHLRISHGYVFQRLIEAPQTIGEIADGLGVTQQAASKAVGELIELGYLDTLADARDRRVRRVALSARGENAVSSARQARQQLEGLILSEVGEDAVATARSVLGALLKRAGGFEAARRRRVRPPSQD